MASLSYAQSLRAIGESLEVLGVSAFDLEKDDGNYIVRLTDSKPTRKTNFVKRIAGKLRGSRKSDKQATTKPLRYTPSDISRLLAEQQSRHGKTNVMADAHKLAQVLRVLGDHLDRKQARVFTLSASSDSVAVWFETNSVQQKRETYTVANLYDMAVHMYLRRSKRFDRVA
jgi:hypothetical protein